jgi:DNA polymerase III epsilon subunit-like protein
MSELSYCAIDFETANEYRGSPCAVGLTRVEAGKATESVVYLMRPPEEVDYFDEFNVALHGITPAMVKKQPRFADRLPEILEFAKGHPLVAHNAAFDLGVIADAARLSGDSVPSLDFVCTLVLARKTYDLLSYRLPFVAEAAGVKIERHHDPAEDARAAAEILLAIAGHHGVGDFDALCATTKCKMGRLTDSTRQGFVSVSAGSQKLQIPGANPDADPAHPLYGSEIAFTGTLLTMSRQQAFELVAKLGAQPEANVTKKTDFLVLGQQDPGKLRPGAELSAKAQKAEELRAKGQKIELLGEDDFLRMTGA